MKKDRDSNMQRLTVNTLESTVLSVFQLINRYKKYNKRGSNSYVYNIPVAFDTETSNYTDSNQNKVGWMYIWMFRFGNPTDKDSIAVYGRESELLDSFLTKLSEKLK